jgi:hypothetical protein
LKALIDEDKVKTTDQEVEIKVAQTSS